MPNHNPMPRGLRRLAAETGLSIATISRALNNNDKVAPATRRRVQAAAEQLGYSPNAAARVLSTQRSRIIGAVIPTLASSIFSNFIGAIEDTLATSGYALVIATTSNDPAIEEKRALDLINMGAEGLIVSGLQHQAGLINYLKTRNIPAIATSTFNHRGALPCIGYDNRALGKMAATHLTTLGHQQIAVVHGPLADNDRTRLRLAGVHQVCADALPVPVPLSVAGGVAATRQILSQQKPPTALLCLSDVLALGVLFHAPRIGHRIPDDLSVMGFDDLNWARHANPPLTTMALPVTDMGRQAAQAMINNLENQQKIRSKRLPGEIVVRHSTRQVS